MPRFAIVPKEAEMPAKSGTFYTVYHAGPPGASPGVGGIAGRCVRRGARNGRPRGLPFGLYDAYVRSRSSRRQRGQTFFPRKVRTSLVLSQKMQLGRYFRRTMELPST